MVEVLDGAAPKNQLLHSLRLNEASPSTKFSMKFPSHSGKSRKMSLRAHVPSFVSKIKRRGSPC